MQMRLGSRVITMNEIKISIIIPIHDGADYLADCLASIECQTLDEIEILCVDDASKDNSAAIVEAFAAKDKRFKLFAFRDNKGAAYARNYALDCASGQFVAFMDCDDWYPSKTTLERLFCAAIDSGLAIAGGSFSEFDMRTGETICDFSQEKHLDHCFTFKTEGHVSYREWQGDYGFTRFVYKKSLLDKHAIRFPCIARHEDPVFFVHAMLAAETFYAIPDVVYCCRVGHKELLISETALRDAVAAICDIIELSAVQDLSILRSFQYDLLQWYCLDAPVKREYGSWKDIGTIVQRQARDSLFLRLDRISKRD